MQATLLVFSASSSLAQMQATLLVFSASGAGPFLVRLAHLPPDCMMSSTSLSSSGVGLQATGHKGVLPWKFAMRSWTDWDLRKGSTQTVGDTCLRRASLQTGGNGKPGHTGVAALVPPSPPRSVDGLEVTVQPLIFFVICCC